MGYLLEPDFEGKVEEHEWEPQQECSNCGEAEEDCECDDPMMEDSSMDICDLCGLLPNDPCHINNDEIPSRRRDFNSEYANGHSPITYTGDA